MTTTYAEPLHHIPSIGGQVWNRTRCTEIADFSRFLSVMPYQYINPLRSLIRTSNLPDYSRTHYRCAIRSLESHRKESNLRPNGHSVECLTETLQRLYPSQVLPGIEPGLNDSESFVLNHYTTGPYPREESNFHLARVVRLY